MYNIDKAYEAVKEYYALYGIDVDKMIDICDKIPLSMHCWQGDDVKGFEKSEVSLSGGIQATGNYPGAARTADELRQDIEKVMSMVPGELKVNLHANYLESDTFVDRNAIEPKHFEHWADWAKKLGIGLDFNPTYFSHPKSQFATLSSADDDIRSFWIEHGIRCRRIGEYFYNKTGKVCVINHWTPDGDKEFPINSLAPRLRLKDSYDKIFDATKDVKGVVDGIESKVFGIGMESYTVGSHEFCMGYVMSNKRDNLILTLDTGHFHPTESVAAKLSSIFTFADSVLLHISRPVRWDSDHVVAYDDETKAIMDELARLGKLDSVYIATDFFDASINRIIAWTVGLRNTRKAILQALLQPIELMKKVEADGDYSSRLAITQEFKAAPIAVIWDYYCKKSNKQSGLTWLEDAKKYEKEVLSQR